MTASFMTKTDHAARAIRAAIATGEARPGEWIRPEDWAQRLQLSVTPVREALRKLEASGIVTIHAHRGAQVTKRTRTTLLEDCRIRAGLESVAVELVLERLDDDRLTALCRELRHWGETFRAACEIGDHETTVDANERFHGTLYEAADSHRLSALLSSLWSAFPFYTVQMKREHLRVAADDHGALTDALERRDVEGALAVLRRHSEVALRNVPDRFEGSAMFADAPGSEPS